MKTIDRIVRAFSNPKLFLRHLNRLYYRNATPGAFNHQGDRVLEEEWDNLLILDACRYDMFACTHSLPGRLESRISRGSTTTEFLRANFHGYDLSDTVYVTANPQLYRHGKDISTNFHAVRNVWKEEGWDEDAGTVRPEVVTEAALKAHEEFPNKRLIIHYMQPHYPFLKSDADFNTDHLINPNEHAENVWGKLMTGELHLDRAEIWDLYVENLRVALPHVEALLTELPGISVVTGDHGNMVGERAFPIPIQEWGHPRKMYLEPLVTVPWLIYESKETKEIVAGDAEGTDENIDSEVVTKRLRDLGYSE